jgi:dolichol-phosphate mannosyltransferase
MRSHSTPIAPALAVVVPMHNEAENVQPLLGEIAAALADEPHETIVVDDGSTDGTVAELARAAAGMRELRVVRHTTQRGQSIAVYNGIRSAAAELVVVLDGDLQNDPADIPRLLAAWRADRDGASLGLIIGHRLQRRDSWLRRVSSRVANAVRSALLRDGTPDTGCGLKLLRRATFLELPVFDHMHRFLPALVLAGGKRVQSVPVNHRARVHGRSHYGVLDRLSVGIVDLAGVAWLTRRQRSKEFMEQRF